MAEAPFASIYNMIFIFESEYLSPPYFLKFMNATIRMKTVVNAGE